MLINRYFSVFRTAARGLEAQRIAMGTASENIANASTTRTADGTPYALKRAVHEAPAGGPSRFSALLRNMQGTVNATDPRHMTEFSIKPPFETADMGPITEVQEETRLRYEYDPTHPHADTSGYVAYPDVNVVEEMARMISANRIYEANLTAVQAAKEMIKQTLQV